MIEGENDLRLDHCESCGGYVKTCNGAERVAVARWLDFASSRHYRPWSGAASSSDERTRRFGQLCHYTNSDAHTGICWQNCQWLGSLLGGRI